jgi:hypothetical protein
VPSTVARTPSEVCGASLSAVHPDTVTTGPASPAPGAADAESKEPNGGVPTVETVIVRQPSSVSAPTPTFTSVTQAVLPDPGTTASNPCAAPALG